jgi:two-component system sensor histidine kinase AtoS
MANSSQFANIPLLRRNPGLAEIEAILDLFPTATFLADITSNRIILANTKATELTSYTRAELSGMDLGKLFNTSDQQIFSLGKSQETRPSLISLSTRNKSKIDVHATFNELSIQRKWILISVELMSVLKRELAARERRAKIKSNMDTIVEAFQQAELEPALNLALKAGALITGSSLLSIYLQNMNPHGQDLELTRYTSHGSADSLPAVIPAQDLVHMHSTQIWNPGKRALSILHRSARSAGLSYLATAPLGPPKAMIGLIAIAGDDTVSQDNLQSNLKILANTITTLIQQHSRLSGLEDELRAWFKASTISETVERSTQDGVVILDADLIIKRLNPAAEIILGYTSPDARGQPVDNILIGTDSMLPALSMAQQGIPTLNLEDIHLYRRSGQPFLARVSTYPAMRGNELEGVIILIQDLTEEEQIQAQAKQLEQRALLGEVTAIFAHEVRNPINNISTGLQLMTYNLSPDDPNQELIGRLQTDCDRLADLMKSVLSFSRPAEYEMEPLDLGVLLNRLLERAKPSMTSSSVQHRLQVEPATPYIEGNQRALEQVFNNLISNAIQAMAEEGGNLVVKVHSLKSSGARQVVEVSVADDGPGISKENQDRIFQPFFTTKPNGTGLGLAITKRIVTAHKGSINVTSIPGGTVFSVHFPAMSQSAKIADQ